MENRKILVLFYSLGGRVGDLAREIAKGATEVAGTEVEIKRVPELIPDEVFERDPELKSRKEAIEKEFPLAEVDDLIKADGVAFGTPVHFGSFASQIKQFIDQLSPVFIKGQMVNKPAAVFCASGSLHGGEELTLISLMIPLLNLGMIPVGIPYPIQGVGPEFDAGSPYGAVFISGAKGEKKLEKDDKMAANLLGRRLSLMTQLLNCGCEKCNTCHKLTTEEHLY
jgi:NAD(P)H dehydrogenase (quinone)